MNTLLDRLSERVGSAFAAEGLDPERGVVRSSDRPDLAAFQCNGALAAAKQAKTNPRALAEQLVARLQNEPLFGSVTVAGPGFLNFDLNDDALTSITRHVAADPFAGGWRTPDPQRILVDYGGPNIAKPMHVGHLRSSIIGESVKRLARAVGDEAIGDIHLGDWGLPMGMLISELARRHPEWPYFDPDRTDGFPEQPPFDMDELEVLYPQASAACKGDDARLAEARAATADLQAGRAGYAALWRGFVKVTRERLEEEFETLGVGFELWNGESDVDAHVASMTDDLIARGVAEESDGAIVVRVAEDDEAKESPPLILRKRDGAATYGTTDLATILDRMRANAPNRILYVVDYRQSLHFEQVFRAAAKGGYASKEALEHIAYGTMNGPDGKPFKTREGGVMKLRDLFALMTDAAHKRIAEAGLAEGLDAEETGEIARMIGLAAVKFADLSHERSSNYSFDVERFTRFEGKTGPYLLYATVRIDSVLRKARVEDDRDATPEAIAIAAPEERTLALALGGFADNMRMAYRKRAPHILCDHAYGLAQSFSAFYAACPILGADEPSTRLSRLALAKATRRQLLASFDILGLNVPTRM